MTWLKVGEEFTLEMAKADISDAAFRLHVEGLAYAMDRENDGRFSEREVRRFAECKDAVAAVQELTDAGFWQRVGAGELQIVHHMEEQPSSAYLTDKRQNEATRQRRKRELDALIASGHTAEEAEAEMVRRGIPLPKQSKRSQGMSRRDSRSDTTRDETRDPERNGTDRSGAERNRSSFDEGSPTKGQYVQPNPDYCAIPGCGTPLTGWLKKNGYLNCVEHAQEKAA
jgi:hypothetical protein